MLDRLRRLSCRGFVSLVGVLLTTGLAPADVITMKNGVEFEGRVLSSDDRMVELDTVVLDVRTVIKLKRSAIASIEEKPLAAGFFDLETKTDDRISNPDEFSQDSNLYLEIPIVGRFGVQIVPKAIERSLSYAVRHKIPHIVFTVDSQGGERVAARDIYKVLEKYDDRLTYHAIIRDAVGVALAVPVWCDNIWMLPGANLGGAVLTFEDDEVDGDPSVLRSLIAQEVGGVAEKQGFPGPLFRAMVDPQETIAAWRDESGTLLTGVNAPEDINPNEILFRNGAGSVLTISRSQAVTIGIAQPYAGDASELGAALELSRWEKESDYGQKVVAEEALKQAKRLARKAEREKAKIAKVSKQQSLTKRYIERNLDYANRWDPEQTTYSRYDETRWNRYWSWGGPQRSTITRSQWRKETDETVRALRQARAGVLKMKKLDVKAEELGIPRGYSEDELAAILDDIDVKVKYLLANRNRPSR